MSGAAGAGGAAHPPGTPPVIGWRGDAVVALDQTRLPHEVTTLTLATVDELVDAIRGLAVRGAPVLGAAGALGTALAVHRAEQHGWTASRLAGQLDRIREARPTAADLAAGVTAMEPVVHRGARAVEAAARSYTERIAAAGRRIAERGADYLAGLCRSGTLSLHTHCNTGALAGIEWGTALGVVRALHTRGRVRQVIVDETRPLLQGSRLTCWELEQWGVDYRLVCDGAAPYLLARGGVDAVVVGADRVAANGDFANKIGTFGLALAARHAGVPFVVAAPESTLDPGVPDGAAIPVEQRSEREVTHVADVSVAPAGARAINPAFDVTPAELVSALVTERRLIVAPSGPAAVVPGRADPHPV
ncbi:S-methyl-5-thioribose-1-phosphate isomerase [Streptomyces xinghaiensis]|uniref:S-methyl-5-thioribose-1-phosphate isomerase n=1 Tax=Streptomyces xinghaiensis TaxID=1038928 RepID=UPI000BB0BC4A|nr:S-methyl-5-thioribose-1-phosphate isomerase [Streptomyces xinghaiensis]